MLNSRIWNHQIRRKLPCLGEMVQKNITEMSAVVSGPEGEEIWYASEETDTIYLFERAYTEQEKGIYQITELNLVIQKG